MAQSGKIEHFQIGEDWESYEERLQQYFKANGITDAEKQVAVFLTVIGSHLYKLLRNLVSLNKPSEKSYEQLTTVLKQHLVPKPIVIAERLKFRRCMQKHDENVATYLASLKQLAEACDFKGFLHEALRDQLVCGLRSEAIQKRLLTEADLDLKKAFEISQAMEAATRQAMELQGATPVDSAHYVTNKITTKQGKRTCYRCGGRHSPNDCRFKEQQCKKCNKQGHIAKMCRSGNNTGNSKTTKRYNMLKTLHLILHMIVMTYVCLTYIQCPLTIKLSSTQS